MDREELRDGTKMEDIGKFNGLQCELTEYVGTVPRPRIVMGTVLKAMKANDE